MPKDTLKLFVSLRGSLLVERERLQKRLAAINQALGSEVSTDSGATLQVPREATTKIPRKSRSQNPMSLRAAVVQVTAAGPKTKKEIMDGIHRLGYRFTGKDPMNSLNVVLYGKPKFKNENGKFSLGK